MQPIFTDEHVFLGNRTIDDCKKSRNMFGYKGAGKLRTELQFRER